MVLHLYDKTDHYPNMKPLFLVSEKFHILEIVWSFCRTNGEYSKQFEESVSVLEVIKSFDRKASKKALAARVNGLEYDLNREIRANGGEISVEPIMPGTRDGLEVLRHSTAHLLAAAVLAVEVGVRGSW